MKANPMHVQHALLRHLGEHRGSPRLYLDTPALAAAGFGVGAADPQGEPVRFRVQLDGPGGAEASSPAPQPRKVSSKRRGARVVPVIDLQVRFGRPTARVGKKTCIVIFDSQRGDERVELGLLVDAVSEVIDIAPADIEPPPNFGAAVRRDFIRGMGKVKNRFVIILEPDRAFDVHEMAELCEAAQQPMAA